MKILARLALPVVVVSFAACGDSGVSNVETSAPDTTSVPRADHGGIEVRLETTGGFVAPDYLFRTLPSLVIYADGLVITQGPQIEIYPGPALTNLIGRQLDGAGLAAVKEAVTSAGLVTATPPDYDQEPMQIADAPTTTLTVTFDGITAPHSAYALSMGQTAESGVRKTLADVVDRLGDLSALVGAAHIGPESTFAPNRFAIRAMAIAADLGTDPSATVVDWPLTAIQLFAAADCLVVDDPAAPALFASMTTATLVRQDGVVYSFAVRPTLPGDAGCGTGG